MAVNQVIPFTPSTMKWEEWNGGLLHYFGEEPIPYVPETEWTNLANSLRLLNTFSVYNVPGPEEFTEWRDWAAAFVESVNGSSF